jgi:hypothetical protein
MPSKAEQTKIIAEILKKKLTKEPGKQAPVSVKEDKDTSILGGYDSAKDTVVITPNSATASNIIAHELQHEIDVKQRAKAKALKLPMPSKEGRGTKPHDTEEQGKLMSPYQTPGDVKDEDLIQEAKGNLKARREGLDAETQAWLDSKVPKLTQKLLGLKAAKIPVKAEDLIQEPTPVTFKEMLEAELAKRKAKK